MDITLDKNKRTFRNFFIIFVNSLSYFILAYLFMYLIGQFATAVIALQYDFSSTVYYYKLVYAIDSGAWTSDAVKLLFSTAPVLSLLFGIISLIIFIQIYDHLAHFKLFFIWFFAHSIIWSFGALLSGTILDQGIGYVVMYFYLMDTEKLIISLFSLTMLLLISTVTTKWFLFSANSYFNELNEHNRAFYTWSNIIFPLVIGSFLFIGVKLPMITYYELFILLIGVIFAVPILLRFPQYPTFYFDEDPIAVKLDRTAIIVAVFGLIAFRVIFEFGVRFSASS
jgi:hypothetical protein